MESVLYLILIKNMYTIVNYAKYRSIDVSGICTLTVFNVMTNPCGTQPPLKSNAYMESAYVAERYPKEFSVFCL